MENKIDIIKIDKNYDINIILDLQNKCDLNILTKTNIIDDLKNNNLYYIAIKNTEIIGYIACSILFDHIDISSVLIDKDYLKQGIATLLIKEIINYSKNNNFKNIFLEVKSKNFKAINLYNKLDFKHISTRKNYYTDDDALIYKLEIED